MTRSLAVTAICLLLLLIGVAVIQTFDFPADILAATVLSVVAIKTFKPR